jgi:hypothetical protein
MTCLPSEEEKNFSFILTEKYEVVVESPIKKFYENS